jgi:ferrous iron transport protein A
MLTQSFSFLYLPLNLLKNKSQGVITDISNKDENIIKKLLSRDVHIGMKMTLEQTFPSFIIRISRTRIAINK